MLTFQEFGAINSRLKSENDTWSDLWACLYFMGESIGRVIMLKYSDVSEGYINFAPKGRLKEKHLPVSHAVSKMLRARRMLYPDDIFIFQSHSNRIGSEIKPVTVIAFNAALKRASAGVTHKNISSKTAGSCTMF